MPKKKTNRRPQSAKSRSVLTRDMILNMPSRTVPSGTVYKREKSFSRLDTARYSD